MTNVPHQGIRMGTRLRSPGVPASLVRIEGARHGFEGANLERANAAMVQWFEQYLGSVAK
jgi:dipeptidyl aminopeptidase/acylaminoacyl peptidase